MKNFKFQNQVRFSIFNLLILFFLINCSSHPQIELQKDKKPQRIVLTWEKDPATSQSVEWRTTTAIPKPQAQISTSLKHFDDVENARKIISAATESITLKGNKIVNHHTARFDSLTSGQNYFYRVGDGEIWSEWNVFRTADLERNPFQFIYLGDAQSDILSEWAPLIRQAYTKAPAARFHLYAGDLVNRGKDDENWEEFFEALGFIARMIPIVPVPGNHDASKELLRPDSSRRIDPLYLIHFALPLNGPQVPDLLETAYYLDYQGVRIIAVNTNSHDDPEQLKWLEKVLAESQADWNIVCHHHPLFSVGREDRDNEGLRKDMMPIYQKYKVDLVLQGHDHRYGRTNKIIDAKPAADDAHAPVYVVSVSGPKTYEHNPLFAHLLQVEVGETQCYQIISVSQTELRYEAWSLDNRLVDAFVLRKDGEKTILSNLKI